MDLKPLGEQVSSGFIVGSLRQRKDAPCRAGHGLMAGDQLTHHVECCRLLFGFLDRGQTGQGGTSMGSQNAKGAYALCDDIQGVPQLGVLVHEHQVQRVEHRPGHIPVEAMGFAVQHVGICEQAAEFSSDLFPLCAGDADVDSRAVGHG